MLRHRTILFFARDKKSARAQALFDGVQHPLALCRNGVVMVSARDVFEGSRYAAADLLHERLRLAAGRDPHLRAHLAVYLVPDVHVLHAPARIDDQLQFIQHLQFKTVQLLKKILLLEMIYLAKL